MTSNDQVIAELTGSGGAFEIVVDDVCGVPTRVYAQRMRSMRELVARGALRGELDWVVQGDRRLTYAAHDAAVRSAAVRLAGVGVKQGDRVALAAANCPEWIVTLWASAALGAVLVPLNAWWKAEELEFGIVDSGAKVFVGDEKRVELMRPRLTEMSELVHVFSIGGAGDRQVRPFDELLGDGAPVLPDVQIDEDDLLAIAYTSGTTGEPKGATITHRQAIANLQNIIMAGYAQALRGTPPPEAAAGLQSASLLIVPLFHVTGCLATMVVAYATGGKLVLMPPGRFDPDRAMEVIERERITAIGGVPTIMWRIVESPNLGEYDLSSVKRASYGGAPAAPELVQRIEQVFPNLRKTLTTAYGLTETASVATMVTGDDYFSHPGSVGRAVPTVEVRVVGAEGRDVPIGETGEIWVKGPTVMVRGYWRRQEDTAAALTDGWFHSGDIGYLDSDGFLYIVDRAKDMIIRAGENIYCVEVENVLFDHPEVVDAAVVGVPHRMLGEEVKAVVHLRAGATTSPDEIRDFCRGHLADFKVPALVEIRGEPLPRNPAGKILKSLLRTGEVSATASSDDAVL